MNRNNKDNYNKILSDNNEDIDHAVKEIKMDVNFVDEIIKKENYLEISDGLSIGNISDQVFLKEKFSCHYNLEKFNDVDISKQHFITGFGPTNAPTGGTLSIILRALFFERETGIDSTIIISNLGAFNSRNISLEKIDYLTKRFIKFIRLLGYKGELRTHNNFNLLVGSGLVAKVLNIKDFVDNEEVLTDLYKSLGIQGEDFSTFVDENYTVADIILPCILEKKERILVFVGIEENYFPKLANLVLERLKTKYPKIFVPDNALIVSVFGKLIGGLNGFPKMSKSIKESSINLDDTEKVIERKIMNCLPEDEKIVLQMINLVSDWNVEKLKLANDLFEKKGSKWMDIKKEYFLYFIQLKKLWESTEDKEYKFDIKNFFKKQND
jgi:hypothetical protein